MPIDPKTWTREEIERHSVDMRQFIDFRQSTLPNGMRIIEAYNSSGLTFTILPDRGLDIWTAHYKGIPLTWISQGSPHPPDFGQTWLQQFNGGLLTTCGLTHVGPGEKDDLTSEWRDLHGRYSRLKAGDVSIERKGWIGEANSQYILRLSAVVVDASLFGEQLQLKRTYEIALDSLVITIMDEVTNLGDNPSPLMILYHFNFGYPLIAHGTRLYTDYEAVYPRDAVARVGIENWALYDAATPKYEEQVFFHHLRGNRTQIALIREDSELGILLTWDTDNRLPYFTQWKNTRQGIFVCGLEPGNCIPEGQNAARKSGRLQLLEPGESIFFFNALSIMENRGVQNWHEINSKRPQFKPIEGCHLDDYAQFAQQE